MADTHSSDTAIDIDGQKWVLTGPLDISKAIPPYICVSYVWGKGRHPEENPFHPATKISDRTVPAMAAVIRAMRPEAIWIDAFCIPSQPTPARRATLESMGYIYGNAKGVAAVLSPTSFTAAREIQQVKDPNESHLHLMDVLEKDPWIESVWTYQEVVNSRRVTFVGEESGRESLDGLQFLSALGFCLERLRPLFGPTPLGARARYPKLDAFEDLIADWQLASYQDRCAAGVIASLDRRVCEDEKNYFYSLIGAITDAPSSRSSAPTISSLAETFMLLCEEKGDYSFIFTSTPRDVRLGHRWRPQPQMPHSLITWHCQGERLEGVREADTIKLKDIIVAERADAMSPKALESISRWLTRKDESNDETNIILESFLRELRTMGFTGSDRPVTTLHGVFFPQTDIDANAPVVIYVATSLRYQTFGSPGMALIGDGEEKSYVPGVFAGEVSGVQMRSEVSL